MISSINSCLKSDKSLYVATAVCIVTLVALSIINSPMLWGAVLICGTAIAMVPFTCHLRERRIRRDSERLKDLEPYKAKIKIWDKIFTERHREYDKFQKLRQKLYNPAYPIKRTLDKLDELTSRNQKP